MQTVFKESKRFLDDDVILSALIVLEAERIFRKRDSNLENLAAALLLTKPDSSDYLELKEAFKKRFVNSGDRNSEDFEEVFSRAAEISNSGGSDRSYQRLLFFVNSLFVRLAQGFPLAAENKLDLLASFIRDNIARENHPDTTVVSFNYDLWTENALWRTGVWNPFIGSGRQFGYGIKLRGCLTPDSAARDQQQFERMMHRGAIAASPATFLEPPAEIRGDAPGCLVLKPNGCLGWLHDTRNWDSAPVLRVSDESWKSPPTYHDPYFIHFPPITEYPVISQYVPLIVPPTRFKRRNHPAFWETDNQLKQRIIAARVVVIIGWSLPETDVDYESLLNRAVWERDRQVELLAVCDRNPNESFYHRFENIFRPKRQVFRWDKGFDEGFISELATALKRI